jgi:hypothetical protein
MEERVVDKLRGLVARGGAKGGGDESLPRPPPVGCVQVKFSCDP